MSAPIPPNTRKFVLDPQGWIKDEEAAGRRSIATQIERANNPDLTLRTLQSQAWLSSHIGKPFDEVIQNWETLRAGWSRRLGFEGAEADDTKFHAHMTDRVARENNWDIMRRGIPDKTEAGRDLRSRSLVADAWEAGIDPQGNKEEASAKGFQKFVMQKVADKSWMPEPERAAQVYRDWVEQFDRAHETYQRGKAAAEKAFPIMKRALVGSDGVNLGDKLSPEAAVPIVSDLNDAEFAVFSREINRLSGRVPDSQKPDQPMNLVEGSAITGARTLGNIAAGTGEYLDKKGFDYKFREGDTVRADWLAKGIPFMAETVAGTSGTDGLQEGMAPAEDLVKVALTREQADAANAVIQKKYRDVIRRGQLREIQQGTVLPIDRDSVIQGAVYQMAESATYMAVTRVPWIGPAMSVAANASDYENKAIAAGRDPEQAKALAPWVGALQTAADYMEGSILLKLPWLKQAFQKMGVKPLASFVAGTATTATAETAVELFQNEVTPELVADIGATFSKNIAPGNWEGMAARMREATAEMLPGMLLMSMVGQGVASIHDVKRFNQIASDPRAAAAWGYQPADIEALANAKTNAEAVKLAREGWLRRVDDSKPIMQRVKEFFNWKAAKGGNPTVANPATVEAPAVPAAEASAAPPGDILSGNGNSAAGEPQPGPVNLHSTPVPENNTQLNADAGISRMFRDDNGWSVEMQDGQRVPVGTVDAAFHFRETLLRARDEKQATAMVQIADEIFKRDKAAGKNSVQIFTGNTVEYNAGQVTSTSPKGDAVTLQFDATNLDRQLQALSPGATSAIVQGRNWVAEDGTRFYETNQSTEGPVTMLHEFAESRFKDFIEGPDGEAMTLAAAKAVAPLFDPAKARTQEEKDFSERVQAMANMDSREKGTRRLSMDEVRETMVDLLVGNEIGQRRDGSRMPAGAVTSAVRNALELNAGGPLTKFRALLNAVKEYLRGVLGIASKLKKALNNGTLKKGDDFHSFADKVMGLDDQKAHNEAVLKEVGAESYSLKVVSKEDDAAYMKAVESGDTATAQRMVADAAKAAGYEVGPLHHGSGARFDQFKMEFAGATTEAKSAAEAFFFTDGIRTARAYATYAAEEGPVKDLMRKADAAEKRGDWDEYERLIIQAEDMEFGEEGAVAKMKRRENAVVYNVYLKGHFLELDAKGETPGNLSAASDFEEFDGSITAAIKKAKREGYSGVHIKNLDDAPSLTDVANHWAVFRPSQVKSSEPVTRDSQGKVIPLSKRFNPRKNEMSFSLGSASLLENVAKRAEALKTDPAEKLAVFEAISKDAAGMARAIRFNDSSADAVSGVAIEAERIDRNKARTAELLAAVEKDFGDISGAEFLAKATNQPVIDAVMRKIPGDKFLRARLRARDGSTAAEYEGAKELPRWLFGGTMAPDQMAQELYDSGLIRDDSPATMWAELDRALQSAGAAKERLSQYAQRKAEARVQAREETNAWAAEQMADLPKRQKEQGRNDMLRSLRALDAMLFKLPAEVRAKVGGFVSLAGLQTNKAREKFLIDRLGKIEKVMERFLRGEYTSRIEKLFERAGKKQDVAGEKAASMVGADASYLLKKMEDAMGLDEAGVAGAVAALDARIASGELTAEQEALALREKELVQLAGDWKNADAAQMAEAHKAALETFEGGWLEWSKKIIAKREARINMRANLAVDSGKGGTPAERFDRAEKDMGWRGKLKDVFLGLSSFREVLQYHFGENSETAKMITDRERKAANAREDEIEEAGDSAGDLFTKLGGSPLKGQKLHFKLAQPSIDNPKGGKLSELQVIQASLMWAQEDGKRHMEAFNWDDASMATLEAGLSPEAKAVRMWLRTRYDAEYGPLNALYKERHGVNLPGHQNYAPITVVPQQAGKGEIVDPVTGVATTGSLLTPGSLRTRSKTATAEPEFRDSLQTYLAHVRQLAHWKAYYDLAVDLNQVFGNRDLGNVTEAAGGKQGLKVLRAWSDYFAQGGTRDAAAFLALNARLNRASGRAAEMILFGRVGTLLVQSTQLGAALAEMPTGAYVKRFGMLFAGKLGWGDALRSEYIQRRMSQAPPIVRQAMDALAATEPNAIKYAARNLGKLIAGADALFTAGTYAITLDYHRTQGAKMGMTGVELDTYAHNEAERSTDRVAQPTRAGARSLFENTSTSPLARAGWAFASEARQKIALAAWAARSFKVDPKKFFRTAAVVWGAGGLTAALIRAAWRDMKDDDDEEIFDARNWSISRLVAQTIAGPFQGVPIFGSMIESGVDEVAGAYHSEGDIFSQFSDGITAAKKLVTGKTLRTTTPSGKVKENDEPVEDTLKAAKSILFTIGLFNDTIAGANSLANLIEDGAKVVDNLDGVEGRAKKRSK